MVLLRKFIKHRGHKVHDFVEQVGLRRNWFPQNLPGGRIWLDDFLILCQHLDCSPHVLLAMVEPRVMEALTWEERLEVEALQEALNSIHVRGIDDDEFERDRRASL